VFGRLLNVQQNITNDWYFSLIYFAILTLSAVGFKFINRKEYISLDSSRKTSIVNSIKPSLINRDNLWRTVFGVLPTSSTISDIDL